LGKVALPPGRFVEKPRLPGSLRRQEKYPIFWNQTRIVSFKRPFNYEPSVGVIHLTVQDEIIFWKLIPTYEL
jgi:hypothetical protein